MKRFAADSIAFVVASPGPLAQKGIVDIVDEREGITVGKGESLGHKEYPGWGVRSGFKKAGKDNNMVFMQRNVLSLRWGRGF